MIPILLLTDGNLGQQAQAILGPLNAPIHWVSWSRGDLAGARRLRRTLEAARWDLCLSFYSDFLLAPSVLERIRLPLNIHPALPALPGVGHDVVPIVEGHGSVGATVHVMDERIDHGPIVAVDEFPLEEGHTPASLRRLNQRHCLGMLRRVAAWIQASGDIGTLECRVREMADRCPWRWGPTYYSHNRVEAMRRELEGGPQAARSMVA